MLTEQDANSDGTHPQAHRWDNGTDAAAELQLAMEVRRAALGRFGEHAIRAGRPLATMEEALVPLYLYHRYQVEAAAKLVGGQWYTYALRGDGQQPLGPVPANDQRRALDVLLSTLSPAELALPMSMLERLPPRPYTHERHRELFDKRTGLNFDILSPATTAADMTVALILQPQRAARLVEQQTLSPELPTLEWVNRKADGSYLPETAQRFAWARRLRGSMLERRSQLGGLVRDRLAMGWSPEQIAGRLRRQATQHRTSHESIDRWIYGPIGRRERLQRYLARAKPRRGRRPRAGRREPAIPNRTPIHWRPARASCRTEFGHWEADLMHFRRQRDALLTLQERRTRITLGGRLASKQAAPTMDQIVATLAVLPKRARRSATFDNGGEWARHERLRAQLGMRTYFCDPHCPWQRGGIENANGVLRRDVPRHATLSHYRDADLDALLWAFNTTPRKCLAFHTPLEAFALQLGVALET